MKKKTFQLAFLLFLVVATFLIVRQQQTMPYQKNSGFVFGTVYNISYQYDRNLQTDIEAVLQRVDDELSMFNKHSTVSRLNSGLNHKLSPMFLEVFKLSSQVFNDTRGAFDPTVAPLVNAWGFGFKNEQLPTDRQVDSLLLLVGMQKVAYDAKNQRLTMERPGIMLDFSAIAKGYGVDCVARLMRDLDIRNYMIEIGGEVIVHGISPKREPWRIGVTKPVEDDSLASGELQAVLSITDRAMATSGNYRNFYYRGGRKYAHTIDPHTGHPVQHSLLSATVLARDCATADAYATAFMVMGIDKARELLDRHSGLQAYFIYTDAQGRLATWCSPSLKEKIQQ